MIIHKKQGCACPKCRECCRREPGWFLPHEIDTAARYLNLTRDEFVAKFCKEHIEENILALSPKTKEGTTECIFLEKNGLCGIHPAKPHECRKVYGCEPASRHKRIREIIKKQWR